MIRCTIRLPNSFAAGDGKVLEITGLGKTQENASEDACCGAMVLLLCAEPTNVVLRHAHWSISTSELLAQFMQRFGQPLLGIPHQPLAVHNSRASPTVTIDMDDQKKTIEEFLRKCLQTHGGEFDPSKISSKRYGSSTPWMVLDSLLNKGDLRSFVEQHPEFTYRAHGPKGMIITWADAHAQDTPSSSSGQALPAPVAGVSSSQAAGDTAQEPPKGLLPAQSGAHAQDTLSSSSGQALPAPVAGVSPLLPAQSFYDTERQGATARWLSDQALLDGMD
jgi:hypothetical protein